MPSRRNSSLATLRLRYRRRYTTTKKKPTDRYNCCCSCYCYCYFCCCRCPATCDNKYQLSVFALWEILTFRPAPNPAAAALSSRIPQIPKKTDKAHWASKRHRPRPLQQPVNGTGAWIYLVSESSSGRWAALLGVLAAVADSTDT